jgi:hypothetical protein
MFMWPTSAAAPNAPRMSSPPRTTPPPKPVPTVMVTVNGWPWPAPKRVSPQAAALASFSTTTGRPVRCSTAARNGSLRQARLGANSTVERAASTNPAAPSPAASTSWSAASSRMQSAMMSSTFSGSWAGVSRRSRARMCPSASTTPAATLVPPMSTPMASPMTLAVLSCVAVQLVDAVSAG